MSKHNAEETNPCLREHELSFKCFDRHNYDKSKCFLEIENYKACKKFWGEVRASRRRQGIYPLLPPVEERATIKETFLKTGKIP
ncbi:coiled-coil-helix-coiled-coil-helix domain-containing protein 7 [Anthonomus grandis grandis]|uniref:coiled-coil-helix-coiled-coil-helix domain-containing protein 7 n=1 Tax=Anthonomus grandis grandis TaxID=2921223 RepID=UPI002166A271|nr:coiled-coil-helix-coiled-coil-helix domain-containing protein 7 [Anthonomus grandis grandis]